MPTTACSKLRKAECQKKQECHWIVGKGCTKEIQNKSKAPSQPTTLISKAVKLKVFKEVHPDAYVGTSFMEAIDIFLYNCIKHILRGSKKTYTIDNIQQAFHNKKYPIIVKHFTHEGNKAVRVGMTTFFTKTFTQKIKETFGKELSHEAALFLAGGLEYLYAELVEISGNIAREDNKKCVQSSHLYTATADDAEFSTMKFFHTK